jgi:hypothetical protein
MKKESFYKVSIAVLIILNLLQIGAHFIQTKSIGDPINMPIKHLGLDDVQEKIFRELIQVHKDKMANFRTAQAALTEAYFNQNSDSLLNEITLIERKKIQTTEQHFVSIKKILKESQLDEFEEFKKRSIKRILGFPPPNKRERNNL